MSEYIDRQALLDAIPPTKEDKQISLYGTVADFISLACDVPAADVAPVVHGEWEHHCICSVCKIACGPKNEAVRKFYSYCPSCGAKMDGKMR